MRHYGTLNYEKAKAIFATARWPSYGKPIANNTRIFRRRNDWDTTAKASPGLKDSYAVRLHYTDVVEFLQNGNVILRSGGWHTVTTCSRINIYAPCSLYSHRETQTWTVTYQGVSYVFKDDMELLPDGKVKFHGGLLEKYLEKVRRAKKKLAEKRREAKKKLAEKRRKERAKQRKEVRFEQKAEGFIDKFIKKIFAGKILEPKKSRETGTNVRRYLKDKNFSPALLLRAMDERDAYLGSYQVLGVFWGHYNEDEKANIMGLWEKVARNNIKKVLTEYIMEKI